MGFVFYDTETTGTNTAFDQILQFAAIKTDHELRELDRFEIRCRLLPYVVPSPGAVLVTGVGPAKFTNATLPSHYEMVRAIKAKLDEWSPAVFVGHNSLSFDEHLLRQALYKTLHPPYLTNTNSNCRADSMRMAQCIDLFAPGVLNIPVGANRQPSYKLDRLAPANGYKHSTAHDAMGDVEATVYLCRLLADRGAIYWSEMVRFAQKNAALDFVENEEFFCFTDIVFRNATFLTVCKIGENPDYATEQLIFDLSVDPEELANLDDVGLATRLSEEPKPVRVLRANASPALLAYEDTPRHLRSDVPGKRILRARAIRIRGDECLAQRLVETYLSTRPERKPSVHVEEQIYDSFASPADQARMEEFQAMDWPDCPRLLKLLSDGRAKILGERLIHVEAPAVLTRSVRHRLDIATARRLMGAEGAVPWLTLPKALADTRKKRRVEKGAKATLLDEMQDYLVDQTEKARELLA